MTPDETAAKPEAGKAEAAKAEKEMQVAAATQSPPAILAPKGDTDYGEYLSGECVTCHRADGGDDVTLIEPSRWYYTCFFLNLVIGDLVDFESTGHSYAALASEYGINVVHDMAIGVDRDTKSVTAASGMKFDYDRLILSPSIDFAPGSVNCWCLIDQDVMPHAYKGGTQAALFKAQVEAMPEGGTYVMVAPPDPHRCRPEPYERISMVAHILSQKNPTAKIIIADPKPKFSKMGLFTEGWENYYSGMIEWFGRDFSGDNVTVDPSSMMVDIDGEEVKADVCNVIPAMKAGRIAEIAGVTNGKSWVLVNAVDLREHRPQQ